MPVEDACYLVVVMFIYKSMAQCFMFGFWLKVELDVKTLQKNGITALVFSEKKNIVL